MATDFKSIPIIDISPILTDFDDASRMAEDPGVAKVVNELDRACRGAGFFYAKGHGIPDSMLRMVRKVAHDFFDLPFQEKDKIKMFPMTGFRGYQRIGENVTQGTPDMHEAIDCYKEIKDGMYGDFGKPLVGPNQWPNYPENFKSLMEEYISLCTGMLSLLTDHFCNLYVCAFDSLLFWGVEWLLDLSRKIMRGIGLALGGSWDEFEGERGGDPFWVMRLIGYPGLSPDNCANLTQNDIGCGAHSDYGLLTLVNQDDDFSALQVKNKSGEWILATPIPATFVCNIGDMLKILSNGLYESTLHRVINNFPKYRTSVAFFYEPNYDAVIEPLDMCIEMTGGDRKFGRAIYGEHLVRKVQTNFIE